MPLPRGDRGRLLWDPTDLETSGNSQPGRLLMLLMVKSPVLYLAALVPLALLFGNGVIGAQLAVLGLTLGIFFGTLSLRRPMVGTATTPRSGP